MPSRAAHFRSLVALAPLLLLASAQSAQAASLSLSSDRTFYFPGEAITIAIRGDAMGMSATGVFAQLRWTGDASFVSSSQQQATSFGGALPWVTGVLTSGPGFADAFNQIGAFQPVVPDELFHASFQVVMSGGYMIFSFDETPGPSQLDFFGASWEPYIIYETQVPEPASGTLLALGLLALGAAGRRAAR